MKKLCGFIFFCLLISNQIIKAQELNATVQVYYPRLTNANKTAIQSLKSTITEYLNNTQWTNERWKPEEKIQCSFVITLSQWDGASGYTATAQVQSQRPIYYSNYTANLININDLDFQFSYTEGQALNFSIQNSGGDLPSLLAYYAYMIIGVDRDTFKEFGGDPFYDKALSILNSAQSSSNDGWKSSGSNKNRYWMISNLMDVNYRPFRQYMYQYHRNGLDLMSDNFSKGQENISKSLALLENMGGQRISAVFLNSYFSLKAEETVNCLITGTDDVKKNAYATLSAADPANIRTYEALKTGNNSNFTIATPAPKKEAQSFSFDRPEPPRF